MNQITVQQPKMMLLEAMADKYALRPDEFSKTVRATCGLANASPEQFAAFLIVAKTYNLNPVTKEIYAFPGRGGGIVPIVSIDGWVNLVNSHGQCDGFEFEMEHTTEGLLSCTCRMYRKDRKHPVTVTEYLSECKRPTDPWKMEHRMLRHKALIQAARYAFGFAGVYDEDEARNIIENEPRDITPKLRVPSPSEIEETVSEGKTDPISSGPQQAAKPAQKRQGPDLNKDYDGRVKWIIGKIKAIDSMVDLGLFWDTEMEPDQAGYLPPDWSDLCDEWERRKLELEGE